MLVRGDNGQARMRELLVAAVLPDRKWQMMLQSVKGHEVPGRGDDDPWRIIDR